jgi:putative oxidoreductase
MSDSALLGLRLTLGSYLAVHGAQKLFGHFDGPGLDAAGAGFEHLGLKPGKAFAALAGTSELVGGVLTAVGGADPVGPLAVAGAMTVASLTHAHNGPLLQKGGYELPASYLAAALALTGTGPGRYSLDRLVGFRLPKGLTRLTFLGAAALTGYSAVQVIKTRRAATRAARATGPEAESSAPTAETGTPSTEPARASA